MSSNTIRDDKFYTYADYLTWPESERWEIMEGVAYAMSPAPSRQHQDISRNLLLEFGNYLREHKCKVYAAPFDVRLPDSNETGNTASTVVQPDLVVVCDPKKLDDKGCSGCPDLIIEILSPSTASYDMIKKRRLYEANKVFEYWVVDPVHQIVTRFSIDEELSAYRMPDYFSKDHTITPMLFPDLLIHLSNIFLEG